MLSYGQVVKRIRRCCPVVKEKTEGIDNDWNVERDWLQSLGALSRSEGRQEWWLMKEYLTLHFLVRGPGYLFYCNCYSCYVYDNVLSKYIEGELNIESAAKTKWSSATFRIRWPLRDSLWSDGGRGGYLWTLCFLRTTLRCSGLSVGPGFIIMATCIGWIISWDLCKP